MTTLSLWSMFHTDCEGFQRSDQILNNPQGDSGGPLTWVEEGRTVTRGITSFVASAGCLSGYPDGDTKVKSYLDWIETETGIIVED